MSRFDIKSWRKSANGKAYPVRIGSAWEDKNGVTRLNFDALPLPDEKGQVSCFLEAPRDVSRDDAPARSGNRPADLDDSADIPF